MQITLTVQVSVPVTLEYDGDTVPPLKQLCDDAIVSFLDHPVIKDGYLTSPVLGHPFIDSIGNGDYDVSPYTFPARGK